MTDWSRFVRPSLPGLEPYRPGPSLEELKERYGLDEIVKLNWNEGLEGPFPGVEEAVAAELEHAWIYPAEAYADLRERRGRVARHDSRADRPQPRDPGAHRHGRPRLPRAGRRGRADDTDLRPLRDDLAPPRGPGSSRCPNRELRHDVDALAAAARENDARLVWLCDPNNPTGSLVTHEEWERLLAGIPDRCTIVVDEAYAEYVDPEVRLDRLRDVEAGLPVVVMRTFSKIFGLAGLRLGYAIVSEPLAAMIDVVLEPFNVNRAALAAGRASLLHPDLVETRRLANEAGRERLAERLRAAGAEPYPSQANFLLVDVGVDDVALTEGLARRGFLVRAGSEFGLGGCVRITTGPVPLMERVAKEVADVRGKLLAEGAPVA